MELSVFDRFSPAYLLLFGAVIAILAIHYQLSKRFAWAGALAPLAYCGFLAWLIVTRGMPPVLDFLILLLGLVILFIYWIKARKTAQPTGTKDDILEL